MCVLQVKPRKLALPLARRGASLNSQSVTYMPRVLEAQICHSIEEGKGGGGGGGGRTCVVVALRSPRTIKHRKEKKIPGMRHTQSDISTCTKSLSALMLCNGITIEMTLTVSSIDLRL